MAINHSMKKILKALSFDGIEVEAARHLASLKAIDPMKIFHKTIDYKIYNGDYEVPVRIYLPREKVPEDLPVVLFFHGGGWVTDCIDNYERICARLASATEHIVVSVEYRLAPEDKFPSGLEDCYVVAKALYTGKFVLNVKPENITLIGDSAGGNLCAALSLMARDRGELMPKRQILIYPAVYSDHTPASPFPSVQENGTDYLLTSKRVEEYLQLYRSKPEDLQNPYLAPLLAGDFSGQPDTLVITAEYDPLRDEGEEYARRLAFAGNRVVLHRMPDALHGFFSLPARFAQVRRAHQYIQQFIAGDDML